MAIPLLLATCNKSTDFNPSASFGSGVDLTGSTLKSDQNHTSIYYSTDNGVTFTAYPVLKVGQKFQVKVSDDLLNKGAGLFLTNTTADDKSAPFYSFDWSASTPAPSNATSDVAEFTYNGSNKILVKIIDMHCPTDLSKYMGGWNVDEGTTVEVDSAGVKIKGPTPGKYLVGLSQDTHDAAKIWMSNVMGQGLNAYMNFTASSNYWDQKVTMPSQPIGVHGGTIAGTGKYDQCRMQLSLDVVYSFIDTVAVPKDTTIVKIDTVITIGGSKVHVTNYPDTTITPAHIAHIPYKYKWTYTFDEPAPLPKYCAYVPSSWTGAWLGVEACTGCSTDHNTITQDGSNPNKFWMNNWWGDGVPVYMLFTPSTNTFDQIVTVPSQSVNDPVDGSTTLPCTASGTGTYDQCKGTFTISSKYVIPNGTYAGTYTWVYNFHK